MKMIIAIMNSDDAPVVIQNLMKNNFSVTKLSSTGGFLRSGNATVLIGVDESKVQEVIDIVSKFSKSRKQLIPASFEAGACFDPSVPIEVTVGGATIFVVDVDRFEKV
ncbi:MAG: cyclic-di-AMP receptor [Clostridia bacterium]|nr:cyclic-di-AMP receptor [Clostridia bacterium]